MHAMRHQTVCCNTAGIEGLDYRLSLKFEMEDSLLGCRGCKDAEFEDVQGSGLQVDLICVSFFMP